MRVISRIIALGVIRERYFTCLQRIIIVHLIGMFVVADWALGKDKGKGT